MRIMCGVGIYVLRKNEGQLIFWLKYNKQKVVWFNSYTPTFFQTLHGPTFKMFIDKNKNDFKIRKYNSTAKTWDRWFSPVNSITMRLIRHVSSTWSVARSEYTYLQCRLFNSCILQTMIYTGLSIPTIHWHLNVNRKRYPDYVIFSSHWTHFIPE